MLTIKDMLTIEQVAEALETSTRTVYRYVKNGDLKARKIGSKLRFLEEDVERFLRGE